MGVTGLWTVVQPCARPTKIETLNRKRLAVDASIWVYQFLKAVRDKEGNALRNSHVVGFFRRICKLLFIGIQPVFVFDGGAPVLKRQTIVSRKQRREGRKEDAVRTAGKLLALQMQRAAEEEERKRQDVQNTHVEEEEELPENMVYVDELQMTQQERQQSRKFKKKDQYHLPELDASLAEMGAPNDPRIMSIEELEAYARQFDTGEDINVYDFSKIDFDSPFFTSLPASDRYNILNAARLRSRLRMGYSKEQLETMFPDRMAFSRFQIERVQERNQLTQRLMNINGMNDDAMWGLGGSGRVAGEKGREYVLVKNDGVEGGWALGVVTSKEGSQESKPIDVDELHNQMKQEEIDNGEGSEEDFEDVPIEGLNRLPKPSAPSERRKPGVSSGLNRQRRALYASRKKQGKRPQKATPQQDDPESLFVADEPDDEVVEEDGGEDEQISEEDDDELQRAIALSLQQEVGSANEGDVDGLFAESVEDAREFDDQDDAMEVFHQSRAEEARPIPKGSYRAIASTVNQRAAKIAPKPAFEAHSGSDSEEEMDLRGALENTRRYEDPSAKPSTRPAQHKPQVLAPQPHMPTQNQASGFSGPLPFEKLDLGSSLLGKKKMQEMKENAAGGFEKAENKKDEAQALPPWFEGNLDEDLAAQKMIEKTDREKAHEFESAQKFQFEQPSVLRRQATREVIDLDAPEESNREPEVIEIDGGVMAAEHSQPIDIDDEDVEPTTMGKVADALQAMPVQASSPPRAAPVPDIQRDGPLEVAPSLVEAAKPVRSRSVQSSEPAQNVPEQSAHQDESEQIDWSESDHEQTETRQPEQTTLSSELPKSQQPAQTRKSPSPDFEDVDIPDEVDTTQEKIYESEQRLAEEKAKMSHVSGMADQNAPVDDEAEEYGFYSDSEDEELMKQLAVEAEEHGRFAAELNHKPQQQNVQEYERELKQLRSQQKKDRRDADEVTHIMISECQQLLKLFGLPYITAPMEAEAQCAELVRLGLVDGIVTDDSDCFLFGGTRIYKNMFNQAKFVECYLSTDLEKEFDLNRQKLIGIAQLLGSDYTEGLPGVGPVTALEILSEFPSLTEFKDWWSGVQMNAIPKSADASNAFRKKFRRNATKLFLPPSFPDPRVELAYTQPEVDSDPSQFQWGVPDLDALRAFLMATIGWSQERTDEVLVPVIRDMNRKVTEGTQSNITAFFAGGTGVGAYAPRVRAEKSKRMGSALDRLAKKAKGQRGAGAVVGEVPDDVEAGEDEGFQKPAPKSRAQRKRKARTAVSDDESGGGDAEFQASGSAQKRKKAGRSKK